MKEKGKRGHPVVVHNRKNINLALPAEMYAAIPGNRTEYIREATKRRMVEDGLIKEDV